MPYIGVSPSNGVRRVHTYTATASQSTFTGAGSEGATLSYKDATFVDVFQNGVLLGSADYTATSGTSIVLTQAASADDLVVVITYDVFSVTDTVSKADGGTFDGNVTFAGTATFSGSVVGISSAADDITAGDAAVNLTTTAGNITIDAQGNDTDIIFKGTDNTSDITMLTLDGSEAGTATFNSGATFGGALLPAADDTHDLGSSSKQWRDIYTGDINLNNTKTRDNEVDGTRGSWTIQEGADDLFLLNRLNGKKYKFKLEEM